MAQMNTNQFTAMSTVEAARVASNRRSFITTPRARTSPRRHRIKASSKQDQRMR